MSLNIKSILELDTKKLSELVFTVAEIPNVYPIDDSDYYLSVEMGKLGKIKIDLSDPKYLMGLAASNNIVCHYNPVMENYISYHQELLNGDNGEIQFSSDIKHVFFSTSMVRAVLLSLISLLGKADENYDLKNTDLDYLEEEYPLPEEEPEREE